MRRLPDWPARLDAAIEAARARPFAWGSMDCCLFAADVVHALTGEDHAAAFRGRYASRREAVALLATLGGLEAVLTSVLGPRLAQARQAQRGDVVLTRTPGGPAVGVCCGARAAFAAPTGLTFLPPSAWASAWRV